MKEYQYHSRIVCAANRNASGDIVVGPRHFDETMIKNILRYTYFVDEIDVDNKFKEQGFINQHGEFLTREEAWIVAEDAGQIIRRVGGDMSPDGVGKLFSENLY